MFIFVLEQTTKQGNPTINYLGEEVEVCKLSDMTIFATKHDKYDFFIEGPNEYYFACNEHFIF
jgi:hypothetical protein